MKQVKRSLDLLADASAHALHRVSGINEQQAMINAVSSFSIFHQHHFTASQGWQLLVQYYQARLAQDPTNLTLVNELLIAIAHSSEESQQSAFVLANAPTPSEEHLDRFWPTPDHLIASTPLGEILLEPSTAPVGEYKNDLMGANNAPEEIQPSPAVVPAPVTDPVEDPAPVAPVTAMEKLQRITELEAERNNEQAEKARQEDEAWNSRVKVKRGPLPDEIIVPDQIVKEYRDFDNFRSGWWREGYPYKIVIFPQPNAPKDAPEYFIHCAERPSAELFNEHARLYHSRTCYIRVKYSDGKESSDITREYTGIKANPTVARTALQKTVNDDWSKDAPWRIRYYDQRVGYECFEYFDFQPGGMLLNKYHRGKHFAKVESREKWIAELKAANPSTIKS
ncbi:TPA: hypothetical protein I9Y37_001940 [Citrobacter freundii]|nr:hypothetical protein [Citrobacter freundii]HAT3963915.1 hypothetical protein [Citrobacter freundii]